MAKGRIEGDKIKVTGFTQSTENEQVYRVTTSGVSTADGTSGARIYSNEAIIRHEKHAYIRLTSEGDGRIRITAVNIRPGSMYVIQYPGFASSYYITGDTFVIYTTYPGYTGAQDGDFVVAGTDIYGNTIISNEIHVTDPGATKGEISLFMGGESKTSVKVDANDTRVALNYVFNPRLGVIDWETISVSSTGSGCVAVITDSGRTGGAVLVNFRPSSDRNREIIYTVRVKALNIYGDEIISNVFTITQGKAKGPSRFFILGDDVSWDAAEAVFSVTYPEGMVEGSAEIIEWSDWLGGKPTLEGNTITAALTPNDTGMEREVWVAMSAMTSDGPVFAEGVLFQGVQDYLLIHGVTAYTEATGVKGFVQSLYFPYTSRGVSKISASGDPLFSIAGGKVVVNQSQKTVRLSFTRNNGEDERRFTISLSGKDTSGGEKTATYTFTQLPTGKEDFILYSGDTSVHSGNIGKSATNFSLGIVPPAGIKPETLGVAENTSSDIAGQYRVYSARIEGENLLCNIYPNEGISAWVYTLRLSGITEDGVTRYSNEFTVNHGGPSGDGWLKFNPTGATVQEAATGYAPVKFTYAGVIESSIYARCHADDDSYVAYNNLTHNNGSGSLSLVFTDYPPAVRKIEGKLMAMLPNGEWVSSQNAFILTQQSTGDAEIKIYSTAEKTQEITEVSTSGGTLVSYYVDYINVNSGQPVYEPTLFRDVNNENALFIGENLDPTTKEYYITFRGKSKSTGKTIQKSLKVIVEGATVRPYIELSSNRKMEDGMYVVSSSGETASLTINYEGIDPSTLGGVIVSQDPYAGTVTFNMSGRTIKFGPSSSGPWEPTNLTGDTYTDDQGVVTGITIPVANGSSLYAPMLLTGITKSQTEYTAVIKLNEGIDSPRTTILVTALTINHATSVSSNTITFVQKGVPPSPDPGPGGDTGSTSGEYQMRVTYYQHNLEGQQGSGREYYYSVFADKYKPDVLRTDLEMDPNSWSVKSAIRRYNNDSNHGQGGYKTVNFVTGDTPPSENYDFWLCTTRYSGERPIETWVDNYYNPKLKIYGYFFNDNREPPGEDQHGKLYTIISGRTTGGVPVSYRYAVENSVSYIIARPTYTDDDQVPFPVPVTGGTVRMLFGYRGMEDTSTEDFIVDYDSSYFSSAEVVDLGNDSHIGYRVMDNTYGDSMFVAGVDLEVNPDDGQTTVYTPWDGYAKKTFTVTGTRLSGGSKSATLTVIQEMANYVEFDGYKFESNFDPNSGEPPKGILTMYFKHGSAISFSTGRVFRYWCKYTANMGNWRNQTFNGTNEKVSLYGPTTSWEWTTDTSKTYSQSCPWTFGESGGRGYIKFTDFQYLYRGNLDNQHSYMYGGRLTFVFEFKSGNKTVAWYPVTITQKIGEESTWNIKTTVEGGFPY